MTIRCPSCQEPVPGAQPGAKDLNCPKCANLFDAPDPAAIVARLQPGEELGGFEIIRHIASGGMGEVYLARQVSLDRQVAVKTLAAKYTHDPDVVKRFLLEVRATASLEHPSIVSLLEAGRARGICFLAMGFVDGVSLDRLLEQQGRLPEAEALRIVRGVAEALDYAWRKQRLLHRDIKPANIMLDRQNQVKLLDLGIAKRPNDEFSLTRRGIAIGTPHYMSPEQARGQDDLDCRADMYSLGATLYHLVTGGYPFDSQNLVEILTKHLHEPLPDPRARTPGLSEATAKLLAIMMAKRREERHTSWPLLVHDLDRALAGQPPAFVAEIEAPPTATLGKARGASRTPAPGTPAQATGRAWRTGYLAGFLLILTLMLVWLVLTVSRMERAANNQAADEPPAPPAETATADPGDTDAAPAGDEATPPAQPWPSTLAEQQTLVRQEVERCLSDGRSPLELLPAAHGDEAPSAEASQHAEVLARLLLEEYPGPKNAWAVGAVRYLANHYRQTKQPRPLEQVLRRRLTLGNEGRIMEVATAYQELSELLQAEHRQADLERLWWDGLRQNPDGRHGVAATCARHLFDAFQEAGREEDLYELAGVALRLLPENNPMAQRLRGLAQQRFPALLAAIASERQSQAEQRLRDRLAGPAKVLESKLREAPEALARARLLLELGQLYATAGLPRDALKHYRQSFEQYGEQDRGEIGALSLQAMAAAYQTLGNTAEWLACMNTLLDRKYQGADGRHGLAAAQALVKFYGEQKDDTLRSMYLKRLIEEFPGPDGAAAASASFELARAYETRERFFLALDTLKQVRQRFPGPQQEFARQAGAEIKRLYQQYPEAMRKLEADLSDGPAPFREYLRFNGVDDYLLLREANTSLNLARELTVEIWLLQPTRLGGREYLLSRYGNNQRGFNLYLEEGVPVWEVWDGQQAQILRAPKALPEGPWVHLAATAAPGSMALFVDGKPVAQQACTKVENDGAGHLRVGRASWQEAGYFRGGLQNILLYNKVLYTDAFTPGSAFEANHPALVAALAGRLRLPREYTRHQVDMLPKP